MYVCVDRYQTKYGTYLILYILGDYFQHEIQMGKSLKVERIYTIVQRPFYSLIVTEKRNQAKTIETFDLDASGLHITVTIPNYILLILKILRTQKPFLKNGNLIWLQGGDEKCAILVHRSEWHPDTEKKVFEKLTMKSYEPRYAGTSFQPIAV